MADEMVGHVPVLLDEVVALLSPRRGDVVLDGTLGRGGHAAAMIPLIGAVRGEHDASQAEEAEPTIRSGGGVYIGMDVDHGNAEFAEARLRPIAEAHGVRLIVVQGNFASARAVLEREGLDGVDGLLADLGFASNQMDDPERGLSFMGDGPLDMRLSPEGGGVTAEALINSLPERELADVIYRFGEERLSRRIARKIVERRSESPITTTGELAEICRRCYPHPGNTGPSRGGKKAGGRSGGKGIHPATRTFQALRIAVNGELDALDGLLAELPRLVRPGGRAGIISFHSLEDRPVKQAFLKMQQDGIMERLTRKPITASDQEVAHNPRSRSAKLRGVKRI